MFDPEDELSLAEFTGLEVSWAEGGTLRFADSIVVDEVQPCSREQLRPVALDPASCQPGDRRSCLPVRSTQRTIQDIGLSI